MRGSSRRTAKRRTGASDLLSMWVGESEKQIAAMFRKASAEGAVLLLDEADGLLRDRRSARCSWELTQVNELLVGMEEHDGLFFCATNLVDELDHASLRRFTLKIRFDYLKPAQAWAMLAALAHEHGTELGGDQDSLRSALAALRTLTPGDFATVGRQLALLGEGADPSRIVAALEEECRAKRDEGARARPVGFR
ncbi:MAG: AAA family ATPase [Deltaproteobacteria bacterium]|nr:AAA family ATPase [Deltaproteobacteria bacterium]